MQLLEIRFKGNRKEYFTWDQTPAFSPGASVVVEVDRGQDLGVVTATGDAAEKKCGTGCSGCERGQKEPRGRVVRAATGPDVHLIEELRKAEEDVRRKVMERVRAHGLAMKVSDAEWQWDRKKLTVYFTAEQRVDFRALVRDLAALFRTRIELRQIGARDEARRLDGVGRCGRQFCCSTWLTELQPVSLSLAKDQNLSLNPAQISGGCGRLLCCLRYEHDFYVASRKRFPKQGRRIPTARGQELVEAIDIFRERVLLKADDGSIRSVALAVLREEVSGLDAPPAPEARPPSSLMTFDEGEVRVTPEQAADAVSPRPRRPRRPRRGRPQSRDEEPRDDHDDPEGPKEP